MGDWLTILQYRCRLLFNTDNGTKSVPAFYKAFGSALPVELIQIVGAYFPILFITAEHVVSHLQDRSTYSHRGFGFATAGDQVVVE